MNSPKPILHNGFKIKENEVECRIHYDSEFEFYKLKGKKYLLLFSTDGEITQTQRQTYNIFPLKIANKQFYAIISDDYNRDSAKQLITNLHIKKGLNNVAGMEGVKEKLFELIINPMLNPEAFERFKVSLPNGILFYGPPGCGKTYIIRALAEEIGYYFLELKHSDFASPYIHESVNKIAQSFDKAREHAPALMFIDEIDGLLPKRENADGGHKIEEINEFLMQLNNAAKDKILVIAATNRMNLIDDAILRSGRFDVKIEIPSPDLKARISLFNFYLHDRPCKEIDINILANMTRGYSASDISLIVENAARSAIKNKSEYIDMIIMKQIIENTPSSLKN